MAVRSARRLLPFRDIDPHDIINLYAMSGTGLAGALVRTVYANPSNDYFYSSDAVGANFGTSNGTANITSNRWENPWKVVLTQSGDSRYNGALGLTLANVQEYDENGNRLITYPAYKQYENNVVLSGVTVPVATRGIFAVNYTVYSGSTTAPTAGSVATISYATSTANGGNGQIDSVPAANIQNTGNPNADIYTEGAVIGNWLSSTGTERNGWALLKLRL